MTTTISPVHLYASIISQNIVISPVFSDESQYFIYCTPHIQNEMEPDLKYMMYLAFHHKISLYSSNNNESLIIDSVELAEIEKVFCLVMSSDYQVYPLIKIEIQVDVMEEAPNIELTIKSTTSTSVSYTVNSTIPCIIWCEAFLKGSAPPSVIELKRRRKQFIRLTADGHEYELIPEEVYILYCYAESVHGSPMRKKIVDSSIEFSTKEGKNI